MLARLFRADEISFLRPGCANGVTCLPVFLAAVLSGILGIVVAGSVYADGEDGEPGSSGVAEVEPFAEDAATKQSAPPAGALVRISLPITKSTERTAKRSIQLAMEQLTEKYAAKDGSRPKLILEFVSGVEAGAGSQYGLAYDLARFLASREMAGVETVAYLPGSVSGHAVLVVAACEQVIMAADAEIGRAGRDEDPTKPIEKAIVEAYREISKKRRTFPVAMALGMLDKQYEVLRVETESGPELVFRRDLEALLERVSEVPGASRQVLVERGEAGWISGRRARSLGLVKLLAADRRAVAEALDLPLSAVAVSPLATQDTRARMLRVTGYVDAKTSNTRRRMIGNCVRDDINYICFWIDVSGGDLQSTLELASTIASLDSQKVRTVAYVPNGAQGVGAIVALACDEIVMRPAATLGGGEMELTREEIDEVTGFLRDEVAQRKQRRWSLPASMFDSELVVDAYKHKSSGRRACFSEEELKTSQRDPNAWRRDRTVSAPGETLVVDGELAVELELAGGVVESFDEFKAREQLEGDVSLVEPGWTEQLIDVLTSPQVASLLLLIGLVGMYSEVQLPGIGVGGFVATVAFILFFWANYMEQTANTLEILLFLVGVACLVLEVFVIPGFGIFGLGGGLMVIVSLVLASQTFVLPGTNAEIHQLRDSLLVVGGSGVAFGGLAMLMRRYLPHTPLFRHVLLEPPGGDGPEGLDVRELMADFRDLIGQQGTVATQLSPAGKVRFGDRLVDVVSDGDLIEKNATVVVSEVHGNRVVVKAVSS